MLLSGPRRSGQALVDRALAQVVDTHPDGGSLIAASKHRPAQARVDAGSKL